MLLGLVHRRLGLARPQARGRIVTDELIRRLNTTTAKEILRLTFGGAFCLKPVGLIHSPSYYRT